MDKNLVKVHAELAKFFVIQALVEPQEAAARKDVNKEAYLGVVLENILDTQDKLKNFYLTNMCNVFGSIHASLLGIKSLEKASDEDLIRVTNRISHDVRSIMRDLAEYSETPSIAEQFICNVKNGKFKLTRYQSPP